MNSSAQFSLCRRYRYRLDRYWGGHGDAGQVAMFIGLNPSTADESADDPTIRRCIGFAKAWGYDGLVMLNLFAFRATDPKIMLAEPDAVGSDNDEWIQFCAATAGVVVAAWGAHGKHLGRADAVRRLVPNLHYLRLNADGSPAHPLYLPKSLTPQPWGRAPRAEQAKGGG